MSKHPVIDPLVRLSVAELIVCYIQDGLLIRAGAFGLPDFAAASLHDNGFERVGDDACCLYEKSYRCVGTPAGVVVKVYVESGVARSNGIDVWPGHRLETCLLALKRQMAPAAISTMELVVFGDKLAGSLLINDALVLRFGTRGRGWRRKYRVVGLSTNATFANRVPRDQCATAFARSYSDQVIRPGEGERHARDPALRSLIDCLETHFGHAWRAP